MWILPDLLGKGSILYVYIEVKKMKKVFSVLSMLVLVSSLAVFTSCEQLGLTSSKSDDNTIGLLLLLGLSTKSQASGFFVTIPSGVAK